jgi:hypothetical protein
VIILATLVAGSLSGQNCVPTYSGIETDDCLTNCTLSGYAPGNLPALQKRYLHGGIS